MFLFIIHPVCGILFSSIAQTCPNLCDPMNCSASGLPVNHQLWEFTQTRVHWVSDAIHFILCHLLLLLPSILPKIRVFSSESVLHITWPKYWSVSFSISPSNEYSGLISFRMDWLDLLAVQGTLKSLLQNHSSKASILRHSAFYIVQWYFVTVAQVDKETLLSGPSIWNTTPLPHSVTQLKAIEFENKFDKLLVITVTYHCFLHSLIWTKCKVLENANDSKNLQQWQL